MQNHQNTYQSLSCSACFLNLRKNGKIKRLKKSNPRLTQAHFLPRLSKNCFNRLQSKQGKIFTITSPNDSHLAENPGEEEILHSNLDKDPENVLKNKRKLLRELKHRKISKNRLGSKSSL